MVARDDAIYTYNKEGRAGLYAFPNAKSYLYCHKGHAVVVSSLSEGENNGAAKQTCTVYSLGNNLIASSFSIPGQLVGFLSEWNGLYGIYNSSTAPVMGKSSSVPHMMLCKEKDLKTKMEILFRKNQYDIAVSLAKGHNVGAEGIAEILRQYGDWLYMKGDLSLAAQQYIKTIPHLEPSYVIKKVGYFGK